MKFVQRKIPAFAGMTIGFIHIIYFSSWWIYLYLWYNKFKKIMLQQQKQNTLSGEQKVGFTLLLIFALLALSLGFLQIRSAIFGSFAMHEVVPFDIKDQVSTIDALRYRDTDQDGLTDFDELYLYNTSIYLDDTDSDGILDGEEIENGKNPLCAEGKDCGYDITLEDKRAEPNIGIAKPTLVMAGIEAEDGMINLTEIFSDPEKVRLLLIENGVEKEVLDLLDDNQLMELTKTYLETTIQGGEVQKELVDNYYGNTENSVEKIINNEDVNDSGINNSTVPNADEIDMELVRKTLLKNGIPPEALEQISDEQIMAYIEQNQ